MDGEYSGEEILDEGLDTISPESEKRGRGRPEYISDRKLRGKRDQLLSLLEGTWIEVGWTLQTIKNSADVRHALKAAWEQDRDNHLVQLLLRPTAVPVPLKTLRMMNRDWIDLGESIRTACDARFRCQKSVERAKEALAVTSEADRDRISEILAERNEAFSRAEATYTSNIRERKELRDALDDGFAYFARAEVVDFCRSKRYTFKPFNIANALAGLPYIGWRQSMKRCTEWRLQDLGSGQYMVVETISLIVSSCKQRSKLIGSAEQWLRDRLPKKSRPVVELAENWYYLKPSLKNALLEKGISTKALPYRIAQIYYRMKTHPSPADLLLAEESQIVGSGSVRE